MGSKKKQTVPWLKVAIRPVQIKNKYHWQISYFDGQKDISKNYKVDLFKDKLDDLLSLAFKSIVVQNSLGNIRIQFTNKGKAIIHQDKSANTQPLSLDLRHNREKQLILPANKADAFLQASGIMTQTGQIRARMQDKFWQINHFLQLVDQTVDFKQFTKQPITVIDCGCGSAHLSFATYHYLTAIKDQSTHLIGLDLKKIVLEKQAKQAQKLGWQDLNFIVSAIGDFKPLSSPDIVLALHACDTATDDALAQAINWGSRYIFSVPCCHHHLQAQLPKMNQMTDVANKSLLRHGIFKERLGDILTDTFRALILRIKGYRTDIIEFTSSEHTAKNIMIRAVKTDAPLQPQFIQEYNVLKASWKVIPYLETLLEINNN